MVKNKKKFVSREIRRQKIEGKPQSQAVAIALSKARRKGFRIPKRNPTGWLGDMLG